MWLRAYVACKTLNIYYIILYRKSVPIPDRDFESKFLLNDSGILYIQMLIDTVKISIRKLSLSLEVYKCKFTRNSKMEDKSLVFLADMFNI